MSAIRSWDADIDEFGRPFEVSVQSGAICKVCALGLDEEDVETLLADWNTFQGSEHDEERGQWRRTFSLSTPPVDLETDERQ